MHIGILPSNSLTKQSSDAEGSLRGLRNISVTGVGEGPQVR